MARKYNRRRYPRRKKKSPRARLNRMQIGQPQREIRKLRYITHETLAAPIVQGAVSTWLYSLNGCYDPDLDSVTGPQPYYFDQYMDRYGRYTVLGAKITLKAINAADTEPCRIGMSVMRENSPLTRFDQYIGNKNRMARYQMLGVESNSSSMTTLTLNWSAKKWFGKPNVTTERDVQGTTGGNPASQAYLHLFTDSPFSASGNPIRYQLIIDYIVLFTEPKDVTAS